MRILVFGSSGQVARSLASLSDQTTSVICLGRPEGDITNQDAVRRSIDNAEPDVVVNAAAYTAVDAAETDIENAFLVNRDGVRTLSQETAKFDLPLIHYSTDYVFDGSSNVPYKPSDAVSPLGVYGQSKLEGENALRDNNDLHVILRTAWVFSPYGKNFVKTMLNLGKDRDELRVVSDQVGNPTYAPDIAQHTLAIARNLLINKDNAPAYGTFHLTNAGEVSWHGFAEKIFSLAEQRLGFSCVVHPIMSSEYPTAAKRPSFSMMDNSSLKEQHGIVSQSWESALSDCIDALKTEFIS